MSTEDGLGVQTLIQLNTSADHPFSFAETPDGLLLLANGIDPVLKWDGLAIAATTAGLQPPTVAMQLGGTGLGYITGKRVAYLRFIDAKGNKSDLSPVSNLVDFGFDGWIEDVNYVKSTGQVTVRSTGHGLTTGEAVAIDGVQGTESVLGVNGRWTITVVDADTFTINGLAVTSGIYAQGGTWTMGIQTVTYGAVPVPSDPNVVRRQILRSLAGNLDVLYVDVDTTDLKSTAFLSQATDDVLATGTPVPLTYGDDDLPYASRNAPPPNHKTVIASHKGRIFAAADAEYSAGHAEVFFNQTKVNGVGTAWRRTLIGRRIYLLGATKPYGITDVDETRQSLTLSAPYFDAPRPFQLYTIRPEVGERRLVYYSEPGLPESWPRYNAFAVPETNDTIVGLVSLGQYLYILERRHIHRCTFQGDPRDGYVFLCSTRGSLNNRTWAIAENKLYLLDEAGIHRFDGADSESISQPVQNLFQSDGSADLVVDWQSDQTLWHAAHDPVRDTIRWFVKMVGFGSLFHAICFNYRTERWWVEQYPTAMTASANATFGARRSLCGTDARRVVCLSEGTYDGVTGGQGTLRGTATGATATTLTDALASFAAVEGAPIQVVSGTGRDQVGIIATVTPTQIEVVVPWTVIPDSTSVYQIGGVQWNWRSGWFRYRDSEEEEARNVELTFRPVTIPSTMEIQLYFDHALVPRAWDLELTQDGVTTHVGDTHIVVDCTSGIGWARQRISGHANTYSFGDRYVSVALSGVQSGEPVRISQLALDGIEE